MDNIQKLPTDDSIISVIDQRTLDQLFQQKKEIVVQVGSKLSNYIILAVLFILLTRPFIDTLLYKFISPQAPYLVLLIKTFLFVFLYFLISQKNKVT